MKKFGLILMFFLPFCWVSAQNLKPYIVGFETTESVKNTQEKVVKQLENNGIKVVGQYQPANDKNRAIIVISSLE